MRSAAGRRCPTPHQPGPRLSSPPQATPVSYLVRGILVTVMALVKDEQLEGSQAKVARAQARDKDGWCHDHDVVRPAVELA